MKRNNSLPGFYIVFEGIIGSGKSVQAKLLGETLRIDYPWAGVVDTYEPGGVPEAEELRAILKNQQLTGEEEVELFIKSRSITLPRVVRSALGERKIIISDRSFLTSTAYQGEGRGMGLEDVWDRNMKVIAGTFPDCVVYINVGIEQAIARSGKVNPDKFDKEGKDFWNRVINGYELTLRKLREENPDTEIIRIEDPDGKLSIVGTHELIYTRVGDLLREWAISSEGRIVGERQR